MFYILSKTENVRICSFMMFFIGCSYLYLSLKTKLRSKSYPIEINDGILLNFLVFPIEIGKTLTILTLKIGILFWPHILTFIMFLPRLLPNIYYEKLSLKMSYSCCHSTIHISLHESAS